LKPPNPPRATAIFVINLSPEEKGALPWTAFPNDLMSFDDHRQSGKEFLADRSKSTVHWHLVPPCRPDNPFAADPAPAGNIYVVYEQHLQR
jgi:hypothetical protein